jgi:hypothetical protein
VLQVSEERFASVDVVDERIAVGDLALVPDVDAVSQGGALEVEGVVGVKDVEEDEAHEEAEPCGPAAS